MLLRFCRLNSNTGKCFSDEAEDTPTLGPREEEDQGTVGARDWRARPADRRPAGAHATASSLREGRPGGSDLVCWDRSRPQLVNSLGLASRIDGGLGILKRHRPYRDSDHVLNIAYNLLCGGQVLDDIEHRRNDAALLDALGARTIPDPTTAGDFCRRFDADAIWRLMRVINDVRVDVWRRQEASFTSQTARIDVDGSIVWCWLGAA